MALYLASRICQARRARVERVEARRTVFAGGGGSLLFLILIFSILCRRHLILISPAKEEPFMQKPNTARDSRRRDEARTR